MPLSGTSSSSSGSSSAGGTGAHPASRASVSVFSTNAADALASANTKYFDPSTIKTPFRFRSRVSSPSTSPVSPPRVSAFSTFPSAGVILCACHAPTTAASNTRANLGFARNAFSRSVGPTIATRAARHVSSNTAPSLPHHSAFAFALAVKPEATSSSTSPDHAFIASVSNPPPARRHGLPARISKRHAATLCSLTSTALCTRCLFATRNSFLSSASVPKQWYGEFKTSPQNPRVSTERPRSAKSRSLNSLVLPNAKPSKLGLVFGNVASRTGYATPVSLNCAKCLKWITPAPAASTRML
mmetsp:Transcript_5518/g.22327  ORF Transcript_5518/g.22327 Transcript_5518/m.22327 type:complete len:300 (+) Transcript_5518:599-1498(+)